MNEHRLCQMCDIELDGGDDYCPVCGTRTVPFMKRVRDTIRRKPWGARDKRSQRDNTYR